MRTRIIYITLLAAVCHLCATAVVGQTASIEPVWLAATNDEPPMLVMSDTAREEALRLAQAAESNPPEPPAPTATAAPTPAPTATAEPAKTSLNFNNAEMSVILKYISDKTGKPVLRSDSANKQVTLINPRTQTDAENLRLLYKALSSLGIAVVETDDLIMVMTVAEARKSQAPIARDGKVAAEDEKVMTYTRQLKFSKAKDMVDRLKPLVREAEALTADESSNTIFYTDTRSYVLRLSEILDMVDREDNQQVKTVAKHIKNASATEILKHCNSFLKTYARLISDGTPKSTILEESSLNTLILRGPGNEIELISGIIDRLDTGPRKDLPKVVRQRPVNYAQPTELVRSAEAFLKRFIAVSGSIGDVPETTLSYEPSTRSLIMRGPNVELEALAPVLDELDKPRAVRSRKMNYAVPDAAIDQALQMMLKDYAESGQPDYKHSITWKLDPFNPSMIVFRGPAAEMDRLFPILDQIDKPTTVLTRRFFRKPEQVFPEAFNLLTDAFLQDGIPKYKPVTTWRRDPLNPAMIILKGPQEEISRLTPILEQLDKNLAERTRQVYSATPEVFIPAAIERMVKKLADEGQADYRPSITWKREEFNPSIIVYKGPPTELDRLFPILDLFDKPLTTQTRKFNNKTPEEVIPKALELMRQQYVDEGNTAFKPTLIWKKDPLIATQVTLKAPADELSRLSALLDRLDAVTTERSRRFYEVAPEQAMPTALELLVKKMEEAGQPGYQPLTEWTRDPFNPSMVTLRGPAAEMDQLTLILEQVDKPMAVQQRKFYEKSPDQVMPSAIEMMVRQYADEGRPNYKPAVTWKRNELNPAMFDLKGPQEELTRLTPILDQLDKPVTVQQRRFYVKTPQEVMPMALEMMVRQYAEEGRPNYQPAVTWKRNELNPVMFDLKGPQEELTRLTPILDQLDKPVTERTRQIYNSSPEEIVPGALERVVRKMAEQGHPDYKTSTTWKREEFNPSILIFRGPPAELDTLFPILDNMDRPLLVSKRAIAYGTPEEVIPVAKERLRQFFDEQGRKDYETITTYRIDPVNNNLVMRGPQEEITALTTILSEIDVPRAQTTNITTQEFPLGIAEAADLIAAASEYLSRRVALEGKPGDKPGVVFQVNPLTRSITLRGPSAQLTYVTQAMTAVEQASKRNQKPLLIYPKRTTVAQLYSDLSQLITAGFPTSGAPVITQLTRLEALIVTARPDDIKKIKEWVDILDRETTENRVVKMVPMENTTPSTIAQAIRSLMPQSTAVMYPDDQANRLIIRDSTASLARIEEIIKELDQPIDSDDVVLEVFNLKSASVYYVYSALNDFASQLAQFRGKSKTKARVLYEPTSATILFFGKKEDVKELLEVANKLDRVALADTKPQIIQLQNAQASIVYSQLSQILPSITNRQTPPVIIPDARMNSLLVATSPTDATKVLNIIKGLDAQAGNAFAPTIVQLKNADATYLYSTLSQIISGAGKVIPDYRSNSLVILDTTANVQRLMPYIEKLDAAEGTEDLKLEIYKTQSASVYYLYSTMSEYASRLAVKKNKARAKTIVQYDPYTNNVILLGEREDVDELLELAKKLDKVTFADSKPMFIYLKNARADQVSSRLASVLYDITSKQSPPRILPDIRLNLLIVAASPQDASKVQEIVKVLDTPGTGLMSSKLMKLENAEASQIASVLQPLLSEAGKMLPDYRTNTVLILDSTDNINRVTPILKSLDTSESKENFVVKVLQVQTANVYAIFNPLQAYLTQLTSAKGTQTRGRPQLTVDPSTQAIIAIGREDDVRDIMRVAEELDKLQWQGQEPLFIQIKNGTASTIASNIRTLMPSVAKGGVSVQIVADDRLNVLIIMAQASDVERVKGLVSKLDIPDSGDLISKIIPMKNAAASSIYSPLSVMKSNRGYLTYDSSSNSLIIRDTSATIARMEKIAMELDIPDTGDLVTKIIPMKNAAATSVYSPLSIIKSNRGYVTYDSNSNSIIVRDTAAAMERVEKMAAELDVPDTGDMITKIIPMKNSPAYSVYSPIYTLKSNRGYVSYDQNSNSLIIRDTSASLARLEKIAADLDTTPATGEWVTEIRNLRQIDPYTAANLVTQLSTQFYVQKGRSRPQVFAYSEATSGSIIVVGVTGEVKQALGIIDQLESAGKAGGKLRLFFLKYTKAYQLAMQLRQVFQSYRNTTAQQTTVISDQFTNSIIGIGSDTDLQKLDELILKLDIPNAAGLEVEIFPLEGVNVSLLVSNLAELSGPQGKLFGDTASNSLVVIDTRDVITRISKVVQELSEKGGSITARVRKLEYGLSSSITTPITQYLQLYSQRQGRPSPRSGIYAEPSTNAVIIFGPTEEVEQIEALIKQLDTEELTGREPRIFTLKYIQATQLSYQLSQLMTTQTGVRSVAFAEPSTNSLIVLAPERDVKRLEEILKQIDVPEAGGLETKVYQLKRSSAANIARNLTPPLISARGKAFAEPGTNVLIVTDTIDTHERVKKFIDQVDLGKGDVITKIRRLENTTVTALASPIQQFLSHQAQTKGLNQPLTQVMQDAVSNSLIVYGPTDEVDLVLGLLDDLDAESLFEREPKIIPLKRAQAAQVGPVLEQLLSLNRTGANAPRVVPDPESNSLIVMAPKADLARADELLLSLDQAKVPGVETRVFRLKNADAAILVSNVRPIVGAAAKLFADVPSNAIVYTDTLLNLDKLGELIKELDTPGAEAKLTTQVIQLKNANALTVDNTLSEYSSHIAIRKGRPSRPLTRVTSDAGTNSIVIIGPSDEIAQLSTLLKELDSEELRNKEPKVIPLKRALAAQLAPVLEELLSMNKNGYTVTRVIPDIETNTILVMASKEDILRAEELLVSLDKAETPGVETRVFRLKNAESQTLVENLRPITGYEARIFPDVPSNSIVYTDTILNLDKIAKLITDLDSPGEEGKLVTQVFPLRNGNAQTIDNTLSEFATHIAIRKGRPSRPLTRVTSDLGTNTIIIIGPTDEVAQLGTLLNELDADKLRERLPKFFFLKNAQASQVAPQVTQIMTQISQGMNAPRIVPNLENNALVVLANPADLSIVESMIQSLDNEEGGLRRARILKLKHADALQLVTSLRYALGPTAAIAAHVDSNSIVVVDTESNIEALFKILTDLDNDSRQEDLSSDVIALENSKAGAITQPLQTIISQINTQRSRKNKMPLQAFADPDANSMVIVGASEEVSQLGRIVRELDSESLSDRKPEVFFLEYARAADISTEIRQLFDQTARYGNPSRVVPDQWANAILVIADPRDMDWIRKLIKELDTREGRKRVVEIFVLENADASVLSERLANLFVPGGGSGSQSRRRSPWEDYFGGRRSEALTEGQVTIIADQRLNALIVTAEPQDMSQVADLIEALDIQAPNLEGPMVYHIENGEADTLAQTLQNLFSDTDYQGGYYYPIERQAAISGLSGKVRVIAEPTTNSIIVLASSPRAFEVVEAMLKQLDRPSLQSGRTNIIPVKNALALDLKKLLTDLFKPEESSQSSRRRFVFDDFFGGGSSGGGGGSGSFSNLIGKVRIEADTRTNSLLVITPELYRASVESLITALDAPTSQVLLETLVVEVTLGEDCDQGIQWGVDPNTGEIGTIKIGNSEVLSFDSEPNADFGSGIKNLQFFSLNQTQFQTVINFLQSNRNLSVQSRPGILTENNRKALVRVGTRTPTITDISVTNGTTNTSVTYENLGLTLEVTPHVNSATEVTLYVNLEDGAIDPTIPPLGGQAYTFTDRQFQTQLVVNNHHTAILAGVISEKQAKVTHEVPVLHRLPYLGDKIFTNDSVSRSKVELLTFITPYILRSRADVLMATEMTMKKSNSEALKNLDIEHGDWPEVYADDGASGDPWEEKPTHLSPNANGQQ